MNVRQMWAVLDWEAINTQKKVIRPHKWTAQISQTMLRVTVQLLHAMVAYQDWQGVDVRYKINTDVIGVHRVVMRTHWELVLQPNNDVRLEYDAADGHRVCVSHATTQPLV